MPPHVCSRPSSLPPSRFPFRRRSPGSPGFSLVEVALALGLVSFAFVSLLGMLPSGLNTFQSAIDTAVGAQIIQRVVGDAQQTDFEALVEQQPAAFRKPVRFFDDQGNELPGAAGAIYHVNTRVTPVSGLPKDKEAAENLHLATVTFQIANNPGNLPLTLETEGPSKLLWKTDARPAPSTYSTLVARIQ